MCELQKHHHPHAHTDTLAEFLFPSHHEYFMLQVAVPAMNLRVLFQCPTARVRNGGFLLQLMFMEELSTAGIPH